MDPFAILGWTIPLLFTIAAVVFIKKKRWMIVLLFAMFVSSSAAFAFSADLRWHRAKAEAEKTGAVEDFGKTDSGLLMIEPIVGAIRAFGLTLLSAVACFSWLWVEGRGKLATRARDDGPQDAAPVAKLGPPKNY